MVSLGDLNELRAANGQLQDLVEREVADLFVMLAEHNPYEARSILDQILPELVNEYGQIAQATAAEWYESTYGARAYLLDTGTPADAVQSNVGYHAHKAVDEDVRSRLSNIQASAARHVRNQGRSTIAHSAGRNGGRWARVPGGLKPCAFCLMLASRDAVYLSERSASKSSRTGDDYHDSCKCEVAQINSWDEYPEGYDPSTYYDIYNEAAKAVGARNDPRQIVYEMRRQNPGLVSDGVFEE